jgi:hypothetical protein
MPIFSPYRQLNAQSCPSDDVRQSLLFVLDMRTDMDLRLCSRKVPRHLQLHGRRRTTTHEVRRLENARHHGSERPLRDLAEVEQSVENARLARSVWTNDHHESPERHRYLSKGLELGKRRLLNHGWAHHTRHQAKGQANNAHHRSSRNRSPTNRRSSSRTNPSELVLDRDDNRTPRLMLITPPGRSLVANASPNTSGVRGSASLAITVWPLVMQRRTRGSDDTDNTHRLRRHRQRARPPHTIGVPAMFGRASQSFKRNTPLRLRADLHWRRIDVAATGTIPVRQLVPHPKSS